MVKLDIKSLCTNIPHKEGTEASREVLVTITTPKPSTKFLLELLDHVFKFNSCMINGKHYPQPSENSMGTKLTHSDATLFMDKLERKLLQQTGNETVKTALTTALILSLLSIIPFSSECQFPRYKLFVLDISS